MTFKSHVFLSFDDINPDTKFMTIPKLAMAGYMDGRFTGS
jgi:hypothetical protein